MKAERFMVLSETRARVLQFTVSGKTPTEIASLLGISRKRVYDHLQALREAGFLA